MTVRLKYRSLLSVIFLLLLWVETISGCQDRILTDSERFQRALKRSQKQMYQFLEESFEEVEGQSSYRLFARWNPSKVSLCECPPIEVFYRNAWHRVYLQGDEDTVKMVRSRGGYFYIQGIPTQKFRVCPQSQQSVELFELIDFYSEKSEH